MPRLVMASIHRMSPLARARFGELDVAEPPGEQRHGAAAFDGGELFLVPGKHQLAAVARRVLGNRGLRPITTGS